jgi:hypothetical protein
MKIKFDSDKIISFIKANLRYLPTAIISIIAVIFAILTLFALSPRENLEHAAEGQARVQELNIRFNTKLLKELSSTKDPAQLGTSAGRDPFSSF